MEREQTIGQSQSAQVSRPREDKIIVIRPKKSFALDSPYTSHLWNPVSRYF